jgi:hypothetical protein
MPKNIEISNINKHFLLHLETHHVSNISKKYKTKLIKECFYSINEYNISNKIKTIKYYSNNYFIIEDYDFVNIGQLNEQFIDKCNLTNDERYLIFKYNNVKMVDFNDFLFNIVSPKVFILNIIESFSYILNSLISLNDNDICFFNLSPQNIGFNFDCGGKPFIHNFQTSLIVSNMDVKYITNIIKKTIDYTHKPLEVHILFYLIQNDISTISYSFIQEVCENFINNASFLTLFEEEYIESYKVSCVNSLSKYINKPRIDIILDIIENSDKWDVYSLSVLYLHIFNGISRVLSLQNSFISKLTTELIKNIHPDPSNRRSLKQLSEVYKCIFNDEPNWSFVNDLSYVNMTNLYDILH